MNVSEIIMQVDDLIDQMITVEGYLYSGDTTFVADPDQRNKIFLPHENTQTKLLDVVPVRLGGNYLYSDSCMVEGIIAKEKACIFIKPHKVVLYRGEDSQYEIKFSAQPLPPHGAQKAGDCS